MLIPKVSKLALVKGHAHSTNQHWYKKVDGVWKFAGLSANIRWFEHDFDKVFAEGRESFGDTFNREAELDEHAKSYIGGVEQLIYS